MEDVFSTIDEAEGRRKGKRSKAPAAVREPAKARPRTDEWPSAVKPRLNFMPEKHRKVEYGRRAVRAGAMLVLSTTLFVCGGSMWAGAVNSALESDLKVINAEINDADTYLIAQKPVTQFYANYVDQRQAVSLRFSDELSAHRVFNEINTIAGSSVNVKDISYDLSDKTCTSVDPFTVLERTGCIIISGDASSPSALAGFVDDVNSGSALFTQAQVTEATVATGRMEFTIQTGFTPEAESNRGQQFTPTEEELAKVVKAIPNRFEEQQQKADNNG